MMFYFWWVFFTTYCWYLHHTHVYHVSGCIRCQGNYLYNWIFNISSQPPILYLMDERWRRVFNWWRRVSSYPLVLNYNFNCAKTRWRLIMKFNVSGQFHLYAFILYEVTAKKILSFTYLLLFIYDYGLVNHAWLGAMCKVWNSCYPIRSPWLKQRPSLAAAQSTVASGKTRARDSKRLLFDGMRGGGLRWVFLIEFTSPKLLFFEVYEQICSILKIYELNRELIIATVYLHANHF